MFISLQIIYPSLYSTPIPSNFAKSPLFKCSLYGIINLLVEVTLFLVPCCFIQLWTSPSWLSNRPIMSSIVPKLPDCLRREFDEPKSIIGLLHDSPQFRHRKYWSLPSIAFLLTRFEPHSSLVSPKSTLQDLYHHVIYFAISGITL